MGNIIGPRLSRWTTGLCGLAFGLTLAAVVSLTIAAVLK